MIEEKCDNQSEMIKVAAIYTACIVMLSHNINRYFFSCSLSYVGYKCIDK